jgi:hypothetical protein
MKGGWGLGAIILRQGTGKGFLILCLSRSVVQLLDCTEFLVLKKIHIVGPAI